MDDAVLHSDETLMADGNPMGIAPEVRHHLLGACEGRLCIDDPLLPPEVSSHWPNVVGSSSDAVPAANWSALGEGGVEAIEILPRKTRERARTGNRNCRRRVGIQRSSSGTKAPPVTRQCTWRCWSKVWPQVCRTMVAPRSPPSQRGSRPKVCSVSHAAWNRRA